MSNVSIEQRYQQLMDLVQKNAPMEEIQKAEVELADAVQRAPFEIKEGTPFFQQLAQKLDATQAFQHFRLLNGRMVDDRREQFMGRPEKQADEAGRAAQQEQAKEVAKEVAKDAAKEGAKAATEEAGKKADAKEAKEGARAAASMKLSEGLDQRAAGKRLDEMLSKFERLVIDRFEGGKQVAQESADGKPHFNPKTEAEWKQFFQNFLDRTVAKKALIDDIKQLFMRGVVQKGGKGIFIGDMHLSNGRVEKFVRFSIIAEALARLRAMMPGSQITKEMLGKMTSEELLYLALAATRGREFAFQQKDAEGRFGLAKAEAQAAEKLGIPLEQQLAKKARMLKDRRGRGMAWYDKDGEPEELPYQFVPWWQWGNLTGPSNTKWVTRVFYGALFIVSLIGIVVLTLRLLAGG
ncbi:MAG: hypothetical protein JXA24_04545 [Proteobacteria bacterium]|nr:hypothetical protein [Pseudomonadota bacterium]